MADISELREQIREKGTLPVMVHLADDSTAEGFFNAFGLDQIDHISDPEAVVYRRFGLLRGGMQQMMGLKVWLRTFQVGVMDGRGLSSKPIGDGFQMPGVFLLHEATIKDQFIHSSIADRPDYLKLATCITC